MPKDKVTVAVGFGLLILAIAFLIPTMADSAVQDRTESNIMSVDETVELNDYLELRLDGINTSSTATDNATVTVTNLKTYDSTQTTINDTENETVEMDAGNVTITNDIRSSDSALLTSTYESTFGWAGGASDIMEYMPLILVIATITIVFGLVAKSI